MSLGIFLFPFRVTRWNTAAQWCMAWCPDAQDPSLGVASTPNCGGFFGENLHDDSKKKLSFWGDVYRLIFETSHESTSFDHPKWKCQMRSGKFCISCHRFSINEPWPQMRVPRFEFTPDLADGIPSGLGALQKGLCQQTGRHFFSGKQLEGKHLKMKHDWEGNVVCVVFSSSQGEITATPVALSRICLMKLGYIYRFSCHTGLDICPFFQGHQPAENQ